MPKLKLVFFGTGPVSLGTLDGIADHFDLEAIITKPEATAPGGRLHDGPVKAWADRHHVPAFQPADREQLERLFSTHHFASPVGLVVDYGLIIPQAVIDSFPCGIVNGHFSLLPRYRGADPISSVIVAGESHTGVSLMLITPELDAGPLLAQQSYRLPAGITTPELTQSLTALSNKMIQTVLPAYVNGSIKPQSQSTKVAPTFTRKLQKADGVIDWTLPAADIERRVRAYIGWPGSRATLAGKDIIITAATVLPATLILPHLCSTPGTPFKTPDGQLAICCGQGALVIRRLKPAGKREMTGPEFLAGHPL